MKFISKISKQGEDYFIRVPRNKREELKDGDLLKEVVIVDLRSLLSSKYG
jgi:predicted metal-dependent hydrolase